MNILDCIQDALDLRMLEKGWNSYNAQPIQSQAIVDTIAILLRLANPLKLRTPFIVPCYDGGIQIEWHSKGGDIELYIENESSPEFYYRDESNDEESNFPLNDATFPILEYHLDKSHRL